MSFRSPVLRGVVRRPALRWELPDPTRAHRAAWLRWGVRGWGIPMAVFGSAWMLWLYGIRGAAWSWAILGAAFTFLVSIPFGRVFGLLMWWWVRQLRGIKE